LEAKASHSCLLIQSVYICIFTKDVDRESRAPKLTKAFSTEGGGGELRALHFWSLLAILLTRGYILRNHTLIRWSMSYIAIDFL